MYKTKGNEPLFRIVSSQLYLLEVPSILNLILFSYIYTRFTLQSDMTVTHIV